MQAQTHTFCASDLPCTNTANNTFTGSNTFSGAVTLKQENAVLHISPSNPQGYSGTELAGWMTSAAASSACNSTCQLFIDAGTFNSVTGTFVYPVTNNGTFSIYIDPSAVINYTGTSDFIQAFGIPGTNSYANVRILGMGTINGTASGLSGIHLKAFNLGRIELKIHGFATGDAVKNEGANTVDFSGSDFSVNLNGLHNVGVVVSNNCYAPNATRYWGGQLSNNTGWGLFIDASQSAATGTGCTVGVEEGSSYITTFQGNGVNGSGTTGNLFVQGGRENRFCCYFEVFTGRVTTSNIILGDASFTADDNVIEGEFISLGTQSVLITRGNHNVFSNDREESGPARVIFCDTNCTQTVVQNFHAPVAAAFSAGTGTFDFIYQRELFGGFGAFNFLNSANSAQGMIFSGIDTIIRGGTSGNVRLQNAAGGNAPTFTGALTIGGGSTINFDVKGSGTLTYTSITAPGCQEQPLTISSTGAGDACFASTGATDIGITFSYGGCRISAANTAQVKVCATTTGTPTAVTWTGWARH